MKGGGPRYESAGQLPPPPEELVLPVRQERVDQIVALRTRSLTVVLDRLEDNFNMGAVLRTCEGMGLQDVHVVENPEEPFHPNGSVTQGCDKWLDLHFHKDFASCLTALKAGGYQIWASALGVGGSSLYTLPFDGKVALVFGNERHGVSAQVLAAADRTFWIPMRGFSQSFNISVAVAATLTRAVSWRVERLGEEGDLPSSERQALKQHFLRLSVKQRKRIYKQRP